jgi:hypothetical protein
MPALRLASYRDKGRDRYGVVTDAGIVDSIKRTALDTRRWSISFARHLTDAREAAKSPADQIANVDMRRRPRPEKIICVGTPS